MGVALLTIFELSTTESWPRVMYACVDAVGIDMQPIRGYHVHWTWFFMSFMLVGSLLMMNLFLGVVIDNFNRMKSSVEGNGVMVTQHQEAWIKTQQLTMQFKPERKLAPPGMYIGDLCFKLVMHSKFDAFIMVAITTNTLVMAMTFFGQTNTYTHVLETCNYTFAFVFTVEAVVKVAAFRGQYFRDSWNRYTVEECMF